MTGFFARIQRNHALEHATMHLLALSGPPRRLVGRSDWSGFWLYGVVDTRDVLRAATEGLARLQRNETWLAVHPRCGTNIAVAALLSSGAVYTVSLIPNKSRLRRLVWVALAVVGALLTARPLGLLIQRVVTTTTNLEGLHIKAIHRECRGNRVVHRVLVS